MKKIILAIFIMLMSVTAIAAVNSDTMVVNGWGKLSQEQQQQILNQISKSASESDASNFVGITPKQLDSYVNLGERFGKMLGGAAKEVGIAANEFVNTPVGKWTLFLIIWKVMGGMLIHLFGGIFIFIMSTSILIWITKRSYCNIVYKYDETKTNIFGNHPLLRKDIERTNEDVVTVFLLFEAVIIVITLITIFSY